MTADPLNLIISLPCVYDPVNSYYMDVSSIIIRRESVWDQIKHSGGPGWLLDLVHCMGESFQDYSRIQDFEADFP